MTFLQNKIDGAISIEWKDMVQMYQTSFHDIRPVFAQCYAPTRQLVMVPSERDEAGNSC